MGNLGVIILSRLWPKAGTDFNSEIFCRKTITIDNHEKTCLKVKDKPIIGIHEDDAFPPNQYDWNKGLVQRMFNEISNGIDTLFLALHDSHILNNNVSQEELFELNNINIRLRNFSGKSICVLFQHENYKILGNQSGIYNILKGHLDNGNIGSFNQDEFIKAIQKYINTVAKKKIIDDAHTLRSEILTPFIPFHLFHQLDDKESLSTDKEWQNIFEECYKAINNTEKNIKDKFKELKELRKDISPDIKNCADEKLNELKSIFRKNEGDCIENINKNNCRKTIEDFAQCLEKIVNCIESGEEASARN